MATNEQALRRSPAPYGHACANCAKAKCKCMIRNPGESCERCLRLSKECTPSKAIRKRNPRKSSALRTSQLEEKLDGLMSLLVASKSISNDPLAQPNAGSAGPPTTSPSNPSIPSPVNGTHTDAFTPSTSVSGTGSLIGLAPWEPTPQEAEDCLETFRTRNLRWFPCIYIPPTISAAQLRTEQPFLWLCIIFASAKSADQALPAKARINEMIYERLILNFEKDLETLVGLLIYIMWFNHRVSLRTRPTLSVLIQLAISVVFDLGLNHPITKDSNSCAPQKVASCITPTTRTLEQMRGVVSCFFASSK
jgi:hypothetical protein